MKIFKRLVVEPLKTALLRDTTKTKVLVFVRFMEYYASRGFPRYTYLNDILLLQKEAKYLESYPYKAKFRESTPQTWP